MSGDFSISNLVSDLERAGCGYTVDKFNDSQNNNVVIQWVWASPSLVDVHPSELDFAKSLLNKWAGGQEKLTPAFDTGLTETIGTIQECPFQPRICPGTHLVSTGIFAVPSPPPTSQVPIG